MLDLVTVELLALLLFGVTRAIWDVVGGVATDSMRHEKNRNKLLEN